MFAFQMRIDLDTKEVERLEAQHMALQGTLGTCSATLSVTTSDLRQKFDMIAPFQKKLRALLEELASLKGKREEALELLKKMQARGLQPDEISFSAAIMACAQCDEWKQAEQLYSDAVAIGAMPQMNKNGEIDLHELSGSVARVAIAWLLECMTRGKVPPPDRGLNIITGKGKHSVNNRGNAAVLKPQLEAMLASAEFAGLGAAEDEQNAGRLVICVESLRAWIAARVAG